jgi:hypothetical protein
MPFDLSVAILRFSLIMLIINADNEDQFWPHGEEKIAVIAIDSINLMVEITCILKYVRKKQDNSHCITLISNQYIISVCL